jgi:hypothetical protein
MNASQFPLAVLGAADTPLAPLADLKLPWSSTSEALPLERVFNELVNWRDGYGRTWDHEVSRLGDLVFGTSDGTRMELDTANEDGAVVLRETAFGQLCNRLGAPPRYLRDLPARLQAGCINHALRQDDRPAKLRMVGSTVRAVVSNRYAPVDDATLFQILDSALRSMGLRGDVRVRGFATGKRTVLRATIPTDAIPVQPGDVVEYGVDLTNSELGLGAIQITPVSYRLVCTNGMRSWRAEESFRVTHRGEVNRVCEMLVASIPLAFSFARGHVELMKKAVTLRVPVLLEELEGLSRLGLGERDVDAIAEALTLEWGVAAENPRALLAGRSGSVYDVANAMTAAARGRAVGARLELEETAHRYLASRAA